MNWLTKSFEHVSYLVDCAVFNNPDAVEKEGFTRANAAELAKFVISACVRCRLLPADLTQNFRRYVYGSMTDNGSAEVAAARHELGLAGVSTCCAHSEDLPQKRAFLVRAVAAADSPSGDGDDECSLRPYNDSSDNLDVGGPPPAAGDLEIALLCHRLVLLRNQMSRSSGKERFLRSQSVSSVESPLMLASRSETRWGQSGTILGLSALAEQRRERRGNCDCAMH